MNAAIKLTWKLIFFVKDSSDKYSRITEEQTQYVHTIKNIVDMLKSEGFSNIKIYDDYNNGSGVLPEESLRAVFCGEKL